jgi:hypothetical protein
LIPTRATRDRAFRAIRRNPPENFERYADWFYFLHVDPVQRWIHLVGMLVGTYLYYRAYLACAAGAWVLGLLIAGIATGPFYGFGVLSHFIYDRGAAKSDPAYWHVTFFTVVYINVTTATGLYQRSLRAFVEQYPFVRREWDLVERTPGEFLQQLFGLL